MTRKSYKTGNRARIMDYLKAAGDKPVSVSQIRTHMEEIHFPVSPTTIYRYLEKLEADGNVVRYAADESGKATYQYTEQSHQCDRHLHLKCTGCGAIEHLDCGFMEEIAEHIATEHGFLLQCRNSVLYGLCGRCRNKT